MKTYTKTIENPRLEISYDTTADNPREFMSNVGYFITCEKNRNSPDSHDALESMVKTAGDEAGNLEEHIKLIEEGTEQITNKKVIAVFPVYRYEHGNVVYKRGTAQGFDVSSCGFYIVTEKTAKEYGGELHGFAWEKAIDAELEVYASWINGEVYMFKVYDEDGNEESFSGGFYSLGDIKAELGEEWKDENLSDYIIN